MKHRRRRFQRARKAYRVSLEKAGASSAWLAARGVVNLPTAINLAADEAGGRARRLSLAGATAELVRGYGKVLADHADIFSQARADAVEAVRNEALGVSRDELKMRNFAPLYSASPAEIKAALAKRGSDVTPATKPFKGPKSRRARGLSK